MYLSDSEQNEEIREINDFFSNEDFTMHFSNCFTVQSADKRKRTLFREINVH